MASKLSEKQIEFLRCLYTGETMDGYTTRTRMSLTERGLIAYEGLFQGYTLTSDGIQLARLLFGSSDPAQPATNKRNLSFQEASDLLAENPDRTDVKLLYANQVRTVTRVTRSIDGFWDVVAGWRYSYDQKGTVDFLWQEVAPAPDDDKPQLSKAVLNGIQQWAETIASDPDSEPVADAPVQTEAEFLADLAAKKLTRSQENTIEDLYRNGESQTFGKFKMKAEDDYRGLSTFVQKVNAPGAFGQHKYILTEEGRQLAVKLLGVTEYLIINNVIDCDPMQYETVEDTASELHIRQDDGEQLSDYLVMKLVAGDLVYSLRADDWFEQYAPVVAENAPSDPYPTGSIVTVCGVQHEVQTSGVFKQLPPKTTVSKVQWHETRLRFADTVNIDGYKLSKPAKLPSNFNFNAKKVSLPNMQQTAVKAPNTRRAMTARQLGRMLKAEPISRKSRTRRNPLQLQSQLTVLNWLVGGESPVKIVSHIETPLTGDTRRIA